MFVWVFASRFYTRNVDMSGAFKCCILVSIIRCCGCIGSIFTTKFSTVNSQSRTPVLGSNIRWNRVNSIDVYATFKDILLFVCMSKIVYIVLSIFFTIIINSASPVPRTFCGLRYCLLYLHIPHLYHEQNSLHQLYA